MTVLTWETSTASAQNGLPENSRYTLRTKKNFGRTPCSGEKMIRMIKSNWKTGTIREKRLKWLKGKWADPVYRKQMTEMSRRTQALPKSRKMRSRQFKKLWKTPSFLRKMARRKLTGVKSPLTEEQWKEKWWVG